MVCGCIFFSTSFSASRKSSAARTATDVVPSPTSSSCTLEILTSTFAAALSRAIALRMVAPSFVTMMSPVELEGVSQQTVCSVMFVAIHDLIRRLQNLIHPLGSQSAFHKIAYCDGAHKRGKPCIFTFLFCDIVCENLGGVVESTRLVRLA